MLAKLLGLALGLAASVSAQVSVANVLPTGVLVNGAIGTAYRQASNRLYVTEYGGVISQVDLTRPVLSSVSFSSVVVNIGQRVDPVTGVVGSGGGFIFESVVATPPYQFRGQGNNQLNGLGVLSTSTFASISAQSLQAAAAYTTPSVSPVVGTVFTIWNTYPQAAANYDYVKVRVESIVGTTATISFTTYTLASAYKVIGYGYNTPGGIALNSLGTYAFVTERYAGTLVRVNLSNANRTSAVVFAAGLSEPHQVALDEPRNVAYLVEYSGLQRLLRVDLATKAVNTVASNLGNPIGLAVSADGRYAFVSAQTAAGNNRILRVDTTLNAVTPIITGLNSPFFLSWSDDTKTTLYFTERNAGFKRVAALDVNTLALRTVLPAGYLYDVNPSSVAVVAPNVIVVAMNQYIYKYTLSSIIPSSAPYLIGIGHVPKTSIVGGYATTDAGYFFQVTDAPFGGTLNLNINHARASSEGRPFYSVLVDGVTVTAPFSDYKWDGTVNKFILVTAVPGPLNRFTTRSPADTWYNPYYGASIDTTSLSNGLHTITVRFWTNSGIFATSVEDSVQIMVDNTWPVAKIEGISQVGAGGTLIPVSNCGIVTGSSDQFLFNITASDPAFPTAHTLSYSLVALWGDNQSKAVTSASYTPVASKSWGGVSGNVPLAPWTATVVGDPTSRQCAHTFQLSVWDRTINGFGYIHYASYSRSITLLLS